MDLDALVPHMTRAILLWEHTLATPVLGPMIKAFMFLGGTSGSFWFLSHVLGVIATKIHDGLDYSLAVVFAVFYNAGLAVLFGGVMAAALIKTFAANEAFMAYEAGGFIFVYLVLGSAYLDSEGRLNDYTIVGYFAGLAAFVACCVHQSLLAHPALADAHAAVHWVSHHPAGKALLGLFALQGFVWRLEGVRRWLFFKSVRVGKKRFFFSIA